jgi:HEAT repeat protein
LRGRPQLRAGQVALDNGPHFITLRRAMKACEIFQKISPALGHEIIGYLRDEQKEVYRATINALAQRRQLRPQFVQKKSRAEQAAWILDTLRFRTCEAVGEQLLQVWLMKGQQPMLVAFLDALGIAHDGKGVVEEIPPDLDAAKVQEAAAGLLEKFPADHVAIYLHIFQLQQRGGWAAIASVLESEPRLKLGVEQPGPA